MELNVIDDEQARFDGVCSISKSLDIKPDERRRFNVFDVVSSSLSAVESTAEAIYK